MTSALLHWPSGHRYRGCMSSPSPVDILHRVHQFHYPLHIDVLGKRLQEQYAIYRIVLIDFPEFRQLLCFTVDCIAIGSWAVFLHFNTLRIVSFVFSRNIITISTISASQSYIYSHQLRLLYSLPVPLCGEEHPNWDNVAIIPCLFNWPVDHPPKGMKRWAFN